MPREIVRAENIGVGDEIEVNLGMGKVFRPVDKVTHNDDRGTVTITLFTSFGCRPRLTVKKDANIVRKRTDTINPSA